MQVFQKRPALALWKQLAHSAAFRVFPLTVAFVFFPFMSTQQVIKVGVFTWVGATGFLTGYESLASKHELDNGFDYTSSEDSISETTTSNEESEVSDCESGVVGSSSSQHHLFGDEFLRLYGGDKAHDLIRLKFISGLGPLGAGTEVIAIHRNGLSSVLARAKARAFRVYMDAVANKCGGNANVQYAWYGASAKAEIDEIMSHGFGHRGKTHFSGLYGCGIYLSRDKFPLESVKASLAHNDGVRHLLLCRVILGKTELLQPGSEQYCPSSEEFDAGVDDLENPKKFIVWTTHMNTHIFPEYVMSYLIPSLTGIAKVQEPLRKLTSPWVPFPALISVMSKCLPPPTMALLSDYHKAHKEGKISRYELIRQLRQVAGDKLLIEVIKAFRAKGLEKMQAELKYCKHAKLPQSLSSSIVE